MANYNVNDVIIYRHELSNESEARTAKVLFVYNDGMGLVVESGDDKHPHKFILTKNMIIEKQP